MNLSIEQTALVCVYLSSVENKERRPLYKDEKADEIVEKLEKSHLRVDTMKNRSWNEYLCNQKNGPKKYFGDTSRKNQG